MSCSREITIDNIPLSHEDIEKKARALLLLGDKTRLKILCFLFQNPHSCVSDVAQSLSLSIANTSHHLQVIKELDILDTSKQGLHIHYTIRTTPLACFIKEYMCHCDAFDT